MRTCLPVQLGLGDSNNRDLPVQVTISDGRRAANVACGWWHTLASVHIMWFSWQQGMVFFSHWTWATCTCFFPLWFCVELGTYLFALAGFGSRCVNFKNKLRAMEKSGGPSLLSSPLWSSKTKRAIRVWSRRVRRMVGGRSWTHRRSSRYRLQQVVLLGYRYSWESQVAH